MKVYYSIFLLNMQCEICIKVFNCACTYKYNPVHPGENYMEREGGWLEETSKQSIKKLSNAFMFYGF